MSLSDILEARTEVTKYYIKRGFTNSRAFILIQDNQGNFNEDNAIITIRCVEGILEKINILGAKNQESFVRNRLIYKNFPVLKHS